MDGIRRTVPRSALRTGPLAQTAQPVPGPTLQQPGARLANTPAHRYVPSFNASASRTPGQRTGENTTGAASTPAHNTQTIAPVRLDGVSASLSGAGPQCSDSPQSVVRWLRVPSREAIALAGSSDGLSDQLSFHSVCVDGGVVRHSVRRRVGHSGRVSALRCGVDGLVAVGSSTGSVSCLRADAWEKGQFAQVGSIETVRGRREEVVGLACMSNRVCVAGGHGSLCVFASDVGQKVSERFAWGEQFDDIGLNGLDLVDESAQLVVGAGASAISVWDIRQGVLSMRVRHPENAAASCVGVDASQPNFIVAGFVDGDACVWDRRSGLEGPFLCRHSLHDGPIWDVGVIPGGSPGRLITCGEDGMVLLVDFAKAAARVKAVSWSGEGAFWKADLRQGDIGSLFGKGFVSGLGVNAVDAHFNAELFAYAGDNATVGFGTFSYL